MKLNEVRSESRKVNAIKRFYYRHEAAIDTTVVVASAAVLFITGCRLGSDYAIKKFNIGMARIFDRDPELEQNFLNAIIKIDESDKARLERWNF